MGYNPTEMFVRAQKERRVITRLPDPDAHLQGLAAWFDKRWERVDFNAAYIDSAEVSEAQYAAFPQDYPRGPYCFLSDGYMSRKNMPKHRLVAQSFAFQIRVTAETLLDYPCTDAASEVTRLLCEAMKARFSNVSPGGRLYWRHRPTIDTYGDLRSFTENVTPFAIYMRLQFEDYAIAGNKEVGGSMIVLPYSIDKAGIWSL